MSLDKYTLVRQLGRGNFGVVSVVRSRVDSRLYVLKEIDLRSLTADVKRAALGEAQLLSSLAHPCIVGYIESFITDAPPLDAAAETGKAGGAGASPNSSSSSGARDTLCIVMEHCAGGDIGEVIRKLKTSPTPPAANAPPFPEEQILDWFIQLALALKYIHSSHILHRDLKAQNVFLTSDSRVKLGDFGISKVLNSEADFAKTVIGTPYYLSPEICEGKDYGKKSDVWSLGLFLYELCTLRHAFDGSTLPALVMKILKGVYAPIPSCYSGQLKALISMMLSLNPAKRPNISQILRLEFVRTRMESLARKYPEIKESWATSMKLNSRKEAFVMNLPAVRPSAGAGEKAHAAHPASSPSSSRRRAAPAAAPISASHKPASSSAAARKPPVSSSHASSSTHNTAGSKAPAAKASSSAASASRAPAPRSRTPPPAAAPVPSADDDSSSDLSDEDDDDDDEDDDETVPPYNPANAAGGGAGGLGSPSRGAIIKAGWFDQAAQEYEALMAFQQNHSESSPSTSPNPASAAPLGHPALLSVSSGDSDCSSSLPSPSPQAASASGSNNNNPATPRKASSRAGAGAGPGSSLKPSASAAKIMPSSAAPASRHRSAASVSITASPSASSSARRKSDGPSSLAGKPSAGGGASIASRGGIKLSAAASPSAHAHPLSSPSHAAAGSAAAGLQATLDADNPLHAMMAEIETHKAKARQWKAERRAAKEKKKAEEDERIRSHLRAMKAIKTRTSMAPNPVGSPSSAAAHSATTDESESESGSEHNLLPPSHSPSSALHNGDASKRGAGGAAAGGSGAAARRQPLASPSKSPSAASAAASAALRSPAKSAAASARKVGKPGANPSPATLSPSPRNRGASPDKSSSSTAAEDKPSPERAEKPRVSVRDFISAKKKEAALAGKGAMSPQVEIVLAAPAPVAATPAYAAADAVASPVESKPTPSPSPSVAVAAAAPAPASSPASSAKSSSSGSSSVAAAKAAAAKSRKSLAPKREISFELVLQSSAQQQAAAAMAAHSPESPQPSPPDIVLVPAPRADPGKPPLPPAAAIGPPSLHPSVPESMPAAGPPLVSRHVSRASSDNAARAGSASGRAISGMSPAGGLTPMESPHDFLVNYVAAGDTPAAHASASASPPPSAATGASVVVGVAPIVPAAAPASPSLSASSAASPPRAAAMSTQIREARVLCCSMLGEPSFLRCYDYLRANKRRRKAIAAGEADPTPEAGPLLSEADQERTVKSWLSADQQTAYDHISSLLFCEDLLAKM